MIKAIFFDFDGTLANTAPGIVCTMQETFRRMGLPVPTDQQVFQTIGLPLEQATGLLGCDTPEKAMAARDLYCRLFLDYEITNISIFPHAAETLSYLHEQGMRMAICTSRDKMSLELILNRHKLTSFFEVYATHDDRLIPKPAPDMVLFLLNKTGLKANEVLVVGDTTFDIDMGNKAGCKTVAVTYGNHTEQQLQSANPTYKIHSFEQLTQVWKLP